MQLPILLAFAATAAASILTKRCSPLRDPELPGGYLPPVPCWQENDPACRPYMREETEMLLDAEHSLAVIYGVSKSCMDLIAEDKRRRADGLVNFDWEKKFGKLTNIGHGTLVISQMPEEVVELYGTLKYMKDAVDEDGNWIDAV